MILILIPTALNFYRYQTLKGTRAGCVKTNSIKLICSSTRGKTLIGAILRISFPKIAANPTKIKFSRQTHCTILAIIRVQTLTNRSLLIQSTLQISESQVLRTLTGRLRREHRLFQALVLLQRKTAANLCNEEISSSILKQASRI